MPWVDPDGSYWIGFTCVPVLGDQAVGEPCTLDYADKASGGAEMTPSEIGKLLGYTREMVRQIQISALAKLRASLDELGTNLVQVLMHPT